MNEIETSLGDMKAEVLSSDLGVNEQMSQVSLDDTIIINIETNLNTNFCICRS